MNLIKLKKLIANGLVAALDFCLGAFLCVWILHGFGIQATALHAIIGGLLGLLPDIDLPSQFMKKQGEQIDHHTTLFHFPLLMIPACAFVAGLIGGQRWGCVTAACLLMHYLHDMTGPYGGLMFFWPFTTDMFGVHGRERHGFSKREIYIRDFGHDHWIRTYWMRPSVLSIPELSFASAAAFGTCLIDQRFWWLAGLSIGAWAGLAFCYFMPAKETA